MTKPMTADEAREYLNQAMKADTARQFFDDDVLEAIQAGRLADRDALALAEYLAAQLRRNYPALFTAKG